MKSLSLDEILAKRRVIVTCGTGGVGKTTLSAAMALRAATLGKKAVVITIDPAKRLATSLGVTHLGNDPVNLTHRVPEKCSGEFWAVMPDTHRTFQDLIESLTTSEATRKKILGNPIFQVLTREFSGSNEYMALQRLHSLMKLTEFDCIILDTPPSRNTLTFLEAPTLLGRLFEEKLIRWFLMPTNKLVGGGMKKALGLLERLTGSGFMSQLYELAAGIFEVQGALTTKIAEITRLLQSDQVGFMLVTGPFSENTEEIAHFVSSIQEHGFHFDGVAINRTFSYLRISNEERTLAEQAKQGGHPELDHAFNIIEALQTREAKATEDLFKKVHAPFTRLPELARDVHSVEDLFYVAMALDGKR